MFAGSTSEALILRATQPVLIVPRAAGSRSPDPETAQTATGT